MRTREVIASLTAVTALVSGCSPSRPQPKTYDITFNSRPEDNFHSSDCYNDPNSWVVSIDPAPSEVHNPSPNGETTIGLAKEWDSEGSPIFAAGVTIKEIGKFTYALATSDHKPGIGTVVDLQEGPYSRVVKGEPNRYDAVLSVRLGDDDQTYTSVNCLPNFKFHGNQKSVPLTPDMIVPSPSTTVSTLQVF